MLDHLDQIAGHLDEPAAEPHFLQALRAHVGRIMEPSSAAALETVGLWVLLDGS